MDNHKQREDKAHNDTHFDIVDDGEEECERHDSKIRPCSHPTLAPEGQKDLRQTYNVLPVVMNIFRRFRYEGKDNKSDAVDKAERFGQ
jgi:hypothetical protein